MAGLDDIRQLYQDYLAEVRHLEQKRRPGDGLLGMGGGPASDSCHDRFAQELEKLLQEIAGERLPSSQVRVVLEYIYCVPLEKRDNQTAYWMLIAVHGFTLKLICQLAPADAGALWGRYRADYPRWERLPVQKQVLSALDAARKPV